VAVDSWLKFPGFIMTLTITQTRTFTITNARYVASKIAADLDLLRVYHNQPTQQHITELAEEAALWLAARYLKCVEYGFRRDNVTVLGLKYTAQSDGSLATDDRPGRVYSEIDVSNAAWYSFLEYNSAFMALSSVEATKFKATLPFLRVEAPSPQAGAKGYWEQSRTYSSNGEGVVRHVFKPL
jgi:hypothetical protein